MHGDKNESHRKDLLRFIPGDPFPTEKPLYEDPQYTNRGKRFARIGYLAGCMLLGTFITAGLITAIMLILGQKLMGHFESTGDLHEGIQSALEFFVERGPMLGILIGVFVGFLIFKASAHYFNLVPSSPKSKEGYNLGDAIRDTLHTTQDLAHYLLFGLMAPYDPRYLLETPPLTTDNLAAADESRRQSADVRTTQYAPSYVPLADAVPRRRSNSCGRAFLTKSQIPGSAAPPPSEEKRNPSPHFS